MVWLPDAKTSRVSYWGAPQTIQVMAKAVLEDANHFDTRRLVEISCEGLDSKDYTSEYLAWYTFILQHTRYMRDPRRTELVKAPWVISQQILAGHRPSIDCLPADTLLLKKGYQFVPIKDIHAGDQIWGYDRWSTVGGTFYKGMLAVDAIRMNNGSTFCATPDHHVYIDRCSRHPERLGARGVGTRGDCYGTHPDANEVVRIPVSELLPGMDLLQPTRLPFGDDEMNLDQALIEGLYISDGWHMPYCFAISGQDGCPKEEQKREVEEACKRLGIPTTWHRKSIQVRDSEWSRRVQLMGEYAPEKHALNINLGEGSAAAMLRGIMADSGAHTSSQIGGRTFTTTSYQLMLQTRILHKMFAVSCGEAFITNHGGLGKNPIWRLSTRPPQRDRHTKRLRVKGIERNVATVPVYDIQTDDHYVYLPTADVTVSNCDEYSEMMASGVLQMGGKAEFVTVAFSDQFHDGRRQYSHVFTRALEPRTRTWIILDPVAAEKTAQMLARVKAHDVWPITS